MPEVTPLPPELSRSVSALARSLVAAARTWTLYPPDHPAVRASVERFGRTINDAGKQQMFGFGVTPDTLLLQGAPAAAAEGAVAEAAAWLHRRDILELSFSPDPPVTALHSFLALLSDDTAAVRQRGGPAAVWQAQGHPSIQIEQIDFSKVLEDRDGASHVRRKDDLWRTIVRSVIERRRTVDEGLQKRLLEIAGDSVAIGDLAADVMAPNCTADGSPMLTSQAAAVIAAYRHLVGVVDVMAPQQKADVLRNLASATAGLDSRVVVQILDAAGDIAADSAGAAADFDLRRAVATAMDDAQVAQLLATTLSLEGQATNRLASVFGTIAPDEERKRRVLTMARSMLTETSFGKTSRFQALWESTEELLLSYNERPFVSAHYRAGLDGVGGRAEAMARDVPAELTALIHTLHQDNIRRLSVTLLIDLLGLESNRARAAELARDTAALGEDLLLAGDYEGALSIARSLAALAADAKAVAAPGARVALDGLVNTSAFHETVDHLGEMEDPAAGVFRGICEAVGPAATDALRRHLETEDLTPSRQRAAEVIRSYGARAVGRLAPLVASPHWFVRRNAAELFGEIGAAEAVPLLQPLLRGGDARVTRAAVRALASIQDPSAARAVHTVLRAATGDLRRAVVDALVAERDRRVVPLLGRILDESDALGADHAVVVETLGAVGVLGGDEAITAVDRIMRTTRWFARRRVRAVKTAALTTLRQIGTPAATAAISRAAGNGDRLLRRLARTTAPALGRTTGPAL
ncbi:MAG TPA: HEAT repeat domain-containing protein [Vicinamibacterales bacterium]|nr:HEAT repeat domain-containing protein [Vicinamibacterales bacterium]